MSATTLDSMAQWLESPALPGWAGIVAALVVLAVLAIAALRAEKSFANAMLALLALIAVGTLAVGSFTGVRSHDSAAVRSGEGGGAGFPALACLEGLAGDAVEGACDRALFVSPDNIAAALAYTARQLQRLDQLAGQESGEAALLRRVLERDRFGFVAQVLMVRDGCTPNECAPLRLFADPARVVTNMNTRTYDLLVARAAPGWNASPAGSLSAASLPSIASGGTNALTPNVPTANPAGAATPPVAPALAGRPTSVDFPSSSSIPAVSIMTPEPTPGEQAAPSPSPPPPAPKAVTAAPKAKAAKPRPNAPVAITPPAIAPADDN